MEICWWNKLWFIRGRKKERKRKKNETGKKRIFKIIALGCGVCPCGWGWVSVLWCFSWLVELVPVFWWMELDLTSLKGSAVSRSRFWSVYGFSTEKAMATHSSTLAWKIQWTEEPGRLHSMGSQRVGHDWATSLSLFTFMHWRRKWQPTQVFLPAESQGGRRLVGCRLRGRTESDTTEAT